MKKILIIISICSLFFIKTTDNISNYNGIYNIKKQDNDFGYIIIPKINLYSIFKENSNVDKSIIVIEPSTYPNNNESVLILAGHSGSGMGAYFNYLYKLKISDDVIIKYMDISYNYKIINIYYQRKTGKIKVYKKKNENLLFLVTCTNNNKKTQTVYVAKMVKNNDN